MIVRLHGGLANQMFQYAFGESISTIREEEVFYNRDYIVPGRGRDYGLDAFNIEGIKFAQEVQPRFDDCGYYDQRVYDVPRGTTFIGYWQTEKYFSDQETVRRGFSLKNKPCDKSQGIANAILRAGNASAFLHVRRGDYASGGTFEFHGMLAMQYYNEAVARIRAGYEGAQFFVFSDDPDWCRANFPGDFVFVDHNKPSIGSVPGQEHEDIWLMSLCRHGAIANSSFSWWGAWLGDTQPGRLVFAPNRWFTAANAESRDIVPDRWIKLDN